MHVVKMLKTVHAADDNGIKPTYYLKGRTYTVSDYLLTSFIRDGAVELSGAGDPENSFEHEHPGAPEDRMDYVPPRKKR